MYVWIKQNEKLSKNYHLNVIIWSFPSDTHLLIISLSKIYPDKETEIKDAPICYYHIIYKTVLNSVDSLS